MENKDYGILLNQDVKLHRNYFKEMVRLLGINVKYKSPMSNKDYNIHGELESAYNEEIVVGCIFDEHINQQTAKLLGWNSELIDQQSLIYVPYDLPNLQVGALFTIPSAYDNTKGRTFRVVKLSTIMIYPASITCELVPEYESIMEKSETKIFKNSDFNLLNEGN